MASRRIMNDGDGALLILQTTRNIIVEPPVRPAVLKMDLGGAQHTTGTGSGDTKPFMK